MVLRDCGETAELIATYTQARYDRAGIEQLTRHIAAVLAQLPQAAGTVGELDMVSAAEREQLLAAGRGPALATGLRPVHEIVAALATEEPGRPALTYAGMTLSYGELNQRADTFAATLVAAGVGRGTVAAILMEPCADMIVAALAVLKTGAGYVPLNPHYPVARLSSMIADARPQVVIGDAAWADQLEVTVLAVGDAPGGPPAPPAEPADLDGTAYVIYTSGTSGEPKGVVVPHAALAASTAARHQVYGFYETFLLLSPLSFDSSVAGVWGTLTGGGRLVIASTEQIRDPDRALDVIASEKATTTLAVPSLYAGLLTSAQRRDADRLRPLRLVILAGEVLPDALLSRHFEVSPAVGVVNEYGPTEATVWSTFRRFERPEVVDIGRPVAAHPQITGGSGRHGTELLVQHVRAGACDRVRLRPGADRAPLGSSIRGAGPTLHRELGALLHLA
ncbi:AMP-binding protein [Micromonospora sp. DT233]|uniref:AMP-binding protein n=1 Tax=Micromonospora sp. DT233 TaxID=3393432 RepID=UPI003CE96F20